MGQQQNHKQGRLEQDSSWVQAPRLPRKMSPWNQPPSRNGEFTPLDNIDKPPTDVRHVMYTGGQDTHLTQGTPTTVGTPSKSPASRDVQPAMMHRSKTTTRAQPIKDTPNDRESVDSEKDQPIRIGLVGSNGEAGKLTVGASNRRPTTGGRHISLHGESRRRLKKVTIGNQDRSPRQCQRPRLLRLCSGNGKQQSR